MEYKIKSYIKLHEKVIEAINKLTQDDSGQVLAGVLAFRLIRTWRMNSRSEKKIDETEESHWI